MLLKYCVQSLSRVQLCHRWTAVRQASLSFTISQSLLKFMSIELVMLSNHLLCPASPPALNLSQHQGLSNWLFAPGRQSIRASASASVLPMSFQGWFPFRLTDLISLQSKGFLRVFSSTTVWKHQVFGAQPSLESNSHIRIWLLEKSLFWLYGPLSAFILIMLQPYLSSHPLTLLPFTY